MSSIEQSSGGIGSGFCRDISEAQPAEVKYAINDTLYFTGIVKYAKHSTLYVKNASDHLIIHDTSSMRPINDTLSHRALKIRGIGA